jgi:hypothetical protein
VVQDGSICTMAKTPSPQSVRLTIAVTPEVHEVFTRMAQASGSSISKCMGEWLGDTIEAAEFMVATMEKAKAAPRLVVQELQSYTHGMAEDLQVLLGQVREMEKEGRLSRRAAAAAPGAAAAARSPRPVTRGGKSRTGRARASGNPEAKPQ